MSSFIQNKETVEEFESRKTNILQETIKTASYNERKKIISEYKKMLENNESDILENNNLLRFNNKDDWYNVLPFRIIFDDICEKTGIDSSHDIFRFNIKQILRELFSTTGCFIITINNSRYFVEAYIMSNQEGSLSVLDIKSIINIESLSNYNDINSALNLIENKESIKNLDKIISNCISQINEIINTNFIVSGITDDMDIIAKTLTPINFITENNKVTSSYNKEPPQINHHGIYDLFRNQNRMFNGTLDNLELEKKVINNPNSFIIMEAVNKTKSKIFVYCFRNVSSIAFKTNFTGNEKYVIERNYAYIDIKNKLYNSLYSYFNSFSSKLFSDNLSNKYMVNTIQIKQVDQLICYLQKRIIKQDIMIKNLNTKIETLTEQVDGLIEDNDNFQDKLKNTSIATWDLTCLITKLVNYLILNDQDNILKIINELSVYTKSYNIRNLINVSGNYLQNLIIDGQINNWYDRNKLESINDVDVDDELDLTTNVDNIKYDGKDYYLKPFLFKEFSENKESQAEDLDIEQKTNKNMTRFNKDKNIVKNFNKSINELTAYNKNLHNTIHKLSLYLILTITMLFHSNLSLLSNNVVITYFLDVFKIDIISAYYSLLIFTYVWINFNNSRIFG